MVVFWFNYKNSFNKNNSSKYLPSPFPSPSTAVAGEGPGVRAKTEPLP